MVECIQLIILLIAALLVVDSLRKHLAAKEALFNKEFGYRKYGEILAGIESNMSQITNVLKVYFGLLISKKLVNKDTPQTYLDFIAGDLLRYEKVLQNYSLQLRTYECKEFWITPLQKETIRTYCKAIEKILYRESLSDIAADIHSIDTTDMVEEGLNSLYLTSAAATTAQLAKYADRAYKLYQDLCEELLK